MKTTFVQVLLMAALPLLYQRASADIVNVALDAPAFANSPLFGNAAIARLTDGDRSGSFHGNKAIAPGFAYWIDLGTDQTIDHITIYPRQDDCCAERFSNVRVSVHLDDGAGNIGGEVWGADLFTDGSNPGSSAGAKVTVTGGMGMGTFAGRWVQITALSDPVPDHSLQMTELEVYAEGLPNLALGVAAVSNRPLYGGANIAMLTDGDRATVFHGDTGIQPGFAYWINMGAEVQMDHIKILARQDGCCGERLSNYRVTMHSDNLGSLGAEVWGATLRDDGSNPGSFVGAKDVVTAAQGVGTPKGQWVRIESLDDPVANYSLQMTELEVYGSVAPGVALLITQHPQSVVSAPPRTVTFMTGAKAINGDPNLIAYQWQKNGADIAGATAATYVTPPLGYPDETATFRCVISYPGQPSLTTDEAGIDINYALEAAAFSNRPLWLQGGWSIAKLVDGDRNGVFHGHTGIEPGFAYEVNMGTTVNLDSLVIYARQDGCCAERLTNYRVSLHSDDNGSIGPEVWGADLHTDGSNTGANPGRKDVLSADLDPFGMFKGQWVRILSLEDPVQNYALQMTEMEVYGSIPPEVKLLISRHPANAISAPFRTATFTAAATVFNGEFEKIGFQWQQNGSDIPGATAGTYVTAPLTPVDEGAKFRCVISYPGIPSQTSDEAVLSFDFNYARGAAAFSNRSLWVPGGWNISQLVDGNRQGVFHGDVNIEVGFAYEVNMGLVVDIDRIDIYPRQDGCCGGRLTNLRVSVHKDDHGQIGEQVWSADLFTDGSNPGSVAGTVVTLASDLDPANPFAGQWVRLLSLEDPVQNYSLQMTELEVIGHARFISAKIVGGQLELTWPAGVLQSAFDVTGPWLDVPGASSPWKVNLEGQRHFYRLRQ